MILEVKVVRQQHTSFEDAMEKIVPFFEAYDESLRQMMQKKNVTLEKSMLETITKIQSYCKDLLKTNVKAEQQIISSKTCLNSVLMRIRTLIQQPFNTSTLISKLPFSQKYAYSSLSGSILSQKPVRPVKPRDFQYQLFNSVNLKADTPHTYIFLNVNFFPIDRSPYDKYEHVHSIPFLREWTRFSSIEVHPTTSLIYLTDPEERQVIILTRLLQHYKTWRISEHPRMPRFAPIDISFSSCGTYTALASIEDNSIAIFDQSFQLILHINEMRFRDYGFYGVNGIAFDAKNDFIVAECGDFTNPRIRKFNLNGEIIGPIPVSNSEFPHGVKRITVTHDNEILMATQGGTFYVHSITAAGEYKKSICTVIRGGLYNRPNSITRGSQGGFALCDENGRCILLYNGKGECLREIKSYHKPYACCFGADGVLYVLSNEDRYLVAY